MDRFFCKSGEKLSAVSPDIYDEYDDHSLLKLIAIKYWVDFFIPIVQRQLKDKFDYKVAYVDTMAGSGITRTKRAGDFFCGSCTGAVLAAIDKNYPFDKIIAVEKNQNKAKALKARLKKINPQLSVDVYDKSLSKVKSIIASELKQDCISCIVIDSEGFQGLTCGSINPLILTWFEYDLGRMRSAALGIGSNAKETGDRLTELLGSDIWKDANDSEITEAFIKRVREETNKSALSIDIMDLKRKHYKMILFTEVPHITKKWKEAIEKRLGSDKGLSIAKLLDVRSGRQSDLSRFL